MTERAFRVLGITDEMTECGFCGKQDLNRTVAFEDVSSGEVVYAGTTCAAYVKMMVLGDDGETKARTAGQILTLAKRAMLQREADDLEAGIRLACGAAIGEIRDRFSAAGYGFLQVDELHGATSNGWLGNTLKHAANWLLPDEPKYTGPTCGGMAERLNRLPRPLPRRLEALRALSDLLIRAWAKFETTSTQARAA